MKLNPLGVIPESWVQHPAQVALCPVLTRMEDRATATIVLLDVHATTESHRHGFHT